MELQWNERFQINGSKQFVAIRAERANLPLLLYVHGGPGDTALPLLLKYNLALAKHFTLVIWEQRGSGKSYYKFDPSEDISIDAYVRDLHALVEQLLKRFSQEKLFLLGHSWGSVLGLRLCMQYPQLLHAYVGCGQVINMKKSSQIAYDFARQYAKGRTADALARADPSYTGEHWLKDLLLVKTLVVQHKGSLYGASNYNRFLLDFLCSRAYTPLDWIRREKGALQSIRRLWQELMGVSFEEVTSFAVPVVFIEGVHDYLVSAEPLKPYFERITSSKALHMLEHSCHFPQWSDPERFHRILLDLRNEIL